MKPFRRLLTVALLVLAATESWGASFTLTPTVVARFDELFSPLPFDATAATPITAGPGYYQVDFNFTISDLGLGEHGFAMSSFDLSLAGALEGHGWTPNSGTADVTPTGSPIVSPSLYYLNLDAGPSGSDLKSIITTIAPRLAPTDPRTNLGKGNPTLLGSALLWWDGVTYSSLSAESVSFGVADDTGFFTAIPGNAAGSVIEFGIPEPGAVRPVPQPAYTPPPVPDPPPVVPEPNPPAPPPPPPPVISEPPAIEPPPSVEPPPTTDDVPPDGSNSPPGDLPGEPSIYPGYPGADPVGDWWRRLLDRDPSAIDYPSEVFDGSLVLPLLTFDPSNNPLGADPGTYGPGDFLYFRYLLNVGLGDGDVGATMNDGLPEFDSQLFYAAADSSSMLFTAAASPVPEPAASFLAAAAIAAGWMGCFGRHRRRRS